MDLEFLVHHWFGNTVMMNVLKTVMGTFVHASPCRPRTSLKWHSLEQKWMQQLMSASLKSGESSIKDGLIYADVSSMIITWIGFQGFLSLGIYLSKPPIHIPIHTHTDTAESPPEVAKIP